MSSAGTMDMTTGNHKKIIVNFAMPVFYSHLLQQLYNSADSLIVGRYLGENALAAVSSSGPLIFLLISFFTGTSMGAGVVMSRYFGAKDKKKLSKAIHTNITLGIITSIALTIFGVIMIYSASFVWAEYKFNDPYKFVKMQGIFLIVGIILMIIEEAIVCLRKNFL